MEELQGIVKSVIFRNDENGFSVIEIRTDDGDEVTAVGELVTANVGEKIKMNGDWVVNRVYGRQFKAKSFVAVAPSTLHAIETYLASGIIKGIGAQRAKSIVSAFGLDALEVIENEPERLKNIPGIGSSSAAQIHNSFMMQRAMRDIIITLQEYGITVSQAMKLYKIFGSSCINIIQENPYVMIERVESIGFKTADKIAMNVGIPHDSDFRIMAGIKYIISWARNEGHTFLPRDVLISAGEKVLGVYQNQIERNLDSLLEEKQLVQKNIDNIVAVFNPHMYSIESECATMLTRLKNNNTEPLYLVNNDINRLEKQFNTKLADKQRLAINEVMSNGVMVITGGPGTGKTTILKFIISIFESRGIPFELCAPTGRAAKRMSEATGVEAMTIHRLLEYDVQEMTFRKNEDNTLYANAVVVDEFSMVDIQLLHALLKALNPNTRLIIVGDADQLPSVGAGNVLRDIIASKLIPVVSLTDIFRQNGRSMIISNAHFINSGSMIELDDKESDFGFEQINDVETAARRVVGLMSGKTNKLLTDDCFKDVQVLAPMKRGDIGVKRLNKLIQEALNPYSRLKHEKKYGESIFREGDKVMQIKNNYTINWKRKMRSGNMEEGEGVFNGDLGTITSINEQLHSFVVLFDDEREAMYDFSMFEEIELAYCVSIHKSQGCEFPIVILPIVSGPPMLLTRNLLYTAVTRARKQVYIVGSRDCIWNMIQNNTIKHRYSALRYLLAMCEEKNSKKASESGK